jgi:ABC-type amino acid transport substrate-binding protein
MKSCGWPGAFSIAALVSQLEAGAVMLAMEYRSVANAYLSHREIDNIEEIKLSPLVEVQHMLIADKVQNRKDFELYNSDHPQAEALSEYFDNWLRRLGISEQRYQTLIEALQRA